MNTYDPSDRIVYVHLSGPADARSTATRPAAAHTASAHTASGCAPLPAGYANQSPRTRLQRRPAPVRGVAPRTATLTA